ncbi:MAG: cation:proton antiporter [Candidatus Aenigmarchaeota archaeon]|nr:cation:proton antiporter [Candidatus Aenigmarchaeota archaeon]
MELVVSLAYCLVISFLFITLFKGLRISAVLGMILAGIVCGSSYSRSVFLEPNLGTIAIIGDLGLLSIMFLAGMEVSWSTMFKETKDAAVVALFASIFPMMLGFLTFMLLGFSVWISFFVGICMSITAEATKAKVLLEVKKLKTKIGSLMMGVGILDDIMGLGLFVLVGYWFSVGFEVRDAMMLSGAIMAFFFGVITHREIGRTEKRIPLLEKILLYLVSPFFYVSMGISFSAHSAIIEPTLVLIIIVVAFTGKMIGTLLTKPYTKLKLNQLYLLGLGMNSRGAVELALAFIAFRAGFLPVNIYSGLIIMALITTLLFPPLFTRIVIKNPDIMN